MKLQLAQRMINEKQGRTIQKKFECIKDSHLKKF
jgi:hypothetical protein